MEVRGANGAGTPPRRLRRLTPNGDSQQLLKADVGSARIIGHAPYLGNGASHIRLHGQKMGRRPPSAGVIGQRRQIGQLIEVRQQDDFDPAILLAPGRIVI